MTDYADEVYLGIIISICKICETSVYAHGVRQKECPECRNTALIYKKLGDVLTCAEKINQNQED